MDEATTNVLRGGLFSLLILQFFAAVTAFIIVKWYPSFLVKAFRWWTRYSSGYSYRILNDPVSLHRFTYIEKGSIDKCKHSVVFLHGFGDTKEGFCTAGKYFPTSLHTVALDLPGHGDAAGSSSDLVATEKFVNYVKEFLDATGLSQKKVHLGGHSMGGGLTCLYATKYPDDVVSVTFVAPVGTYQTEMSTLEKMPPSEIYSLMVPKTTADFKKLLSFLTYKNFTLPDFLLAALLDDKKQGAEFQVQMLKLGEMFRSKPQEMYPNITKPTLCIWGDDDQMTHVSGAHFIKEKIPHSKIHIIEKCGHAILLDKPRELAMKMIEFIQEFT